jgi:peptide/nickel transport system substrate-binding protein
MTDYQTLRPKARPRQIAAVFVAAVILAACGSSSSPSGGATTAAPATTAAAAGGSTTSGPVKDGGKLTVGIGSEPEQLDPDKVRAGTDLYVTYNMFETLLARTVEGKLVPGLASAYTQSADGLTYQFTLRSGVTFQNGDPVTAEDVKFSFERYIDPALGNVFAFQLGSLDSVTVDSPSQVTIRLKKPDGAFLSAGGYAFIVPEKYVTTGGADNFAANPIGTGPWKFVSRDIGQDIKFTRYDGYWDAKPGYSSLELRILKDDNGRVAALRSGEVDVISAVPPQSISQIQSDSNLKAITSITGDNIDLLFNNKLPDAPWANLKVRQAMSYAIDYKTLIDKVLGGLGVGFTGVSPLNAGYVASESQQPAYDPAKAKQLLADAGFKDGFSLDLVGPVNGRLPNSEQVVQAVAGFWQDIGLKVNVQLIAYSQWVDQEKAASTINGVVFGLNGDGTTFDPQSRINNQLLCAGPYSHTCDPALETMIAKVVTTVDPNARIQAYKDLFKYVNDNVYDIYLYQASGAFGMKKSVNWQPWNGIPYTNMKNAQPA